MRSLAQIAAADLGLSESPKGSNQGPQLQKFFNADDLAGDGYPWCASAVSFWVQTWVKEHASGLHAPRLAAVSQFRDWADTNRLHVCATPSPGAIVVFNFSHIGVVEKVSPNDPTITTIEGNTNDDGGREGFAVYRKSRPLSQCKFFITLP